MRRLLRAVRCWHTSRGRSREVHSDRVAVECVLMLFLTRQLGLFGPSLAFSHLRRSLGRVRIVQAIDGCALRWRHRWSARRFRAGRLCGLNLSQQSGGCRALLLFLQVLLCYLFLLGLEGVHLLGIRGGWFRRHRALKRDSLLSRIHDARYNKDQQYDEKQDEKWLLLVVRRGCLRLLGNGCGGSDGRLGHD